MKYLSESIKDTFNQVLMILISNVWGKYQFYQTNLPITSTINIKHTWRSETRLASYIWKLKDNGIPYTLKWNIHKWSRLIFIYYVTPCAAEQRARNSPANKLRLSRLSRFWNTFRTRSSYFSSSQECRDGEHWGQIMCLVDGGMLATTKIVHFSWSL